MLNNNKVREIIQSSPLDKLDTKLLLREVLGISQAQLIIQNEYSLNNDEYKKFNTLVEKRLLGMPISYILGRKEFFSRAFKVNSYTLTPRPETEILVESVLDLVKNIKSPKLIDLGTGSGCIAITCKLEQTDLDVTATDISQEALIVASENAKILGADVKFLHSDWLAGINEKFDVIVSNPPYIAHTDQHLLDLKYEPLTALTDFADGFLHICHIIKTSLINLKIGGYLILEHGFEQGDKVRQIFAQQGFKSIKTIRDYIGHERVTFGMKNN